MGSNRVRLCEQLLDDQRLREDGLEIALFGAAKLAWCPSCGRKVTDSFCSADDKERWTAFPVERVTNTAAFGALKMPKGKRAVIVLVQRSGSRAQVRLGVDGRELWPMQVDTLAEAEGVASALREQLVGRGSMVSESGARSRRGVRLPRTHSEP